MCLRLRHFRERGVLVARAGGPLGRGYGDDQGPRRLLLARAGESLAGAARGGAPARLNTGLAAGLSAEETGPRLGSAVARLEVGSSGDPPTIASTNTKAAARLTHWVPGRYRDTARHEGATMGRIDERPKKTGVSVNTFRVSWSPRP
jgi:hypothetical protein